MKPFLKSTLSLLATTGLFIGAPGGLLAADPKAEHPAAQRAASGPDNATITGAALPNQETNGKLKLGDPIPEVTSTDQNGKPVNLAHAAQTGYALVYFYPKAMSPGCTAQACSLRDAYAQLQEKGVKVFGVSVDPVEAQKAFEQKERLPFELLSDADRQVTSAFGVPLMNNGLATRQAYLFKDGRLVWLDTKASTDKQAQDVLAVLASR